MTQAGSSGAGGPAEPGGIDWAQAEAWDRAYYLHATQAGSELSYLPIERVDGSYLVLPDGTRLLDFQSQLISDSMGHRHPRVHAEIARAMERYGHVFFALATDYRARAAKLLLEDVLGAPHSWAGRVRILASGTEAVEQALLMARLSTGRQIVLSQAHSYHGFTVGTTMLRGYRGNLTPGEAFDRVVDVPGFPAANVVTIPAPEFHDYDGPRPLPSLVATEEIIRAVGPENIAAVITETMLGGAGVLPPDDYLPGLVELARRYGILWVADEVLTGFGRMGEWFGYQCYPGLEPDLLVMGKGLNGCALPCGAVVASRAISEPIEQARWWSGSTHDGHPLVCASIVGTIETFLDEDVLGRVRTLGRHLEAGLRELAGRHPSVRRVSGKGLYYAVDLARPDGTPIVPEDRGTAFLGDLSGQPNNVVARECAARGVFLGGFVPNTIKVAPPFTVSEAEIDVGLAAFDEALSVVDDLAARA